MFNGRTVPSGAMRVMRALVISPSRRVSSIAAGFFVAIPAGIFDIGTLADLSNIGTLFAFVLVAAGVLVLYVSHRLAELRRIAGDDWAARVCPIYIGDDRTDEDMFSKLDSEAWTIRVGGGLTRARFSLHDVRSVLGLLDQFAGLRRVGGA